MIYIFNKNKILSYLIASFLVVILFVFSAGVIPNDDIKLVKVSANTVINNEFNINNVT